MEAQSLAELTVEKAAEVLAEVSVSKDFEKQANNGLWNSMQSGLNNATGALSKTWQGMKPWQKGLAVGAGGGALLGGLSSLGRRREERQPGQSALTGLLAGGLLGGGLGLGYQYGPKGLREGIDSAYNTATGWLGGSPGSASGAATGGGQGETSGRGPGHPNYLKENMLPENVPVTRDMVSGFGPNQLAAINEDWLTRHGGDNINDLATWIRDRQNQLVQQARQGADTSTMPGVLGSGAASMELLRRKMREGQFQHSSRGGQPSDVGRALASGDFKNFADEFHQRGVSNTDAEALGRQVAKDYQRPLREPTPAIQKALNKVQMPTAAKMVGGIERGGDWVKRHLEQPRVGESARQIGATGASKGYPDLSSGAGAARDAMGVERKTSPTKQLDTREMARQLLDAGRNARLSAARGMPRSFGRAARGGGAVGLPLLLQYYMNERSRNDASNNMRRILGMDQ